MSNAFSNDGEEEGAAHGRWSVSRPVLAAGIALLVAAFAGGFLARGQSGVPGNFTPGFSGPVDRQAFGWLEGEVSTTNPNLHPMPSLEHIYLCRGRRAVVDVSAEVSGGPVAFTVAATARRGPRRLYPRSVVRDVGEGRRVVSFSRGRPSHFRKSRLALFFASPSGNRVTVHSASVHVTYQGGPADFHSHACGVANA